MTPLAPMKRITTRCGRARRVFVIPAAEAAELKVGEPIALPDSPGKEFRITKIEDTEILATVPLPGREPRKIPFLDLVAFDVPPSAADRAIIWKLLENLRRYSVVFKRVTVRRQEHFRVRQDHLCIARTILQAVQDLYQIDASEKPAPRPQ